MGAGIPSHVAVARSVPAPPAAVYDLLADYRGGHPRVLPPQYFRDLTVEEGGIGAGTVIRVTMRVAGATRTMRMLVTEPEPGRVLVETDPQSGTTTTFTVDAQPADPDRAQVTIATDFTTARGGLAGTLESFMTRMMLRRIYALELTQLAAVVRQAGS